MLYDYIITNYQKDEPIFLAELPGKSRESVRQEMKKIWDLHMPSWISISEPVLWKIQRKEGVLIHCMKKICLR